ncbi:DUF2971 domain-containing protein [Dickeya oryzae]|uniref:DUF2971 domain-containing protein n=1 Tax=Dickeya oryzae TaxID=1240404 RepID=UPI001AECBFCF|nr:DUF2971 domain-containing protein [Dickeya oryzae]MBP2850848.1 DUF2971 domain-containing protein [Dickeya oryzae]
METSPDILYKYRPFDQYLLSMILSKKIYLSSPSQFNDPLDCIPLVLPHSYEIERCESILIRLYEINLSRELDRIYKGYSISQSVKEKFSNFARIKAEDTLIQNDLQGLITGYEESIFTQLMKLFNPGIFCMAESYENILMWSHYAAQHQGVCLGYKTNKVKDEIHKVCYDEEKHKLLKLDALLSWIEKSEHNLLTREYIETCFLNKRKEWEYENEWRLISNEGPGETYTELELCEVYFGYKMNDKIKSMLSREINSLYSNVDFYQMNRVDNSYSLNRGKYPLPD